MLDSNIQWTSHTWNIARGCSKVDKDCIYCYMYRDSYEETRFDPHEVTRTKTVFDMPLKLKEPSKIFACSLTDFFHEKIDDYRYEAWDIIKQCPHHTFQVLTKRPQRIADHLPAYWEELTDHVWLGTSIGWQGGMHRLTELIESVETGLKFLSLEPLHEPLNLGLHRISSNGRKLGDQLGWVIIGGESGNDNGKYRYRPCQLGWIEDLVSQCHEFNIPVFVKQMGTYLSKKLGMSDRHGGNINEFPKSLRIRQFPELKSR